MIQTPVPSDLMTLSSKDLIEGVREELHLFQQRQSTQGDQYALELFRRALVLQDEGAWAGLYTLYERMVFSWVLHLQPRPHCFSDEEILTLVSDTFTRFAKNISATKFPAFSGSVPALLAYLKRCARSCLFNALAHQEQKQRVAQEESLETVSAVDLVDSRDPADLVAEWDTGNQLWRILLRHMHSPQERVVLSSMAAQLPPGDLLKQYPTLFRSSEEIYRIKHTIIARCQRIPWLQALHRNQV